MCIRIYIFNFKKQQINKQKKTVIKENKRNQRRKENISGKSIKKNKFAAAWGKIFHVTYISGNKSFFVFFWPDCRRTLIMKIKKVIKNMKVLKKRLVKYLLFDVIWLSGVSYKTNENRNYALEKDNKVSNYLRLCGYVVFSVA